MREYLKKNQAETIEFPMLDSAAPASFKSALSPADEAYYKDGAGAWTALSITDTASEIGSSGKYSIDLTAAEMNHDRISIKMTASGAADNAIIIRTFAVDINDLVRSTTPANTLDVEAGGTAGIDFNNINGTHPTVPTVTTLTGHTPQTGDSYAVVNHAEHGNSKLLRPITQGNEEVAVDSDGNVTAGNIVSGVGGVNILAESFTLTFGTVASGTVANTVSVDSNYHQIQDAAGVIDAYYQFDISPISPQGIPTNVTFTGRLTSANDSLTLYAWNWAGSAWVALGPWAGQGGATDIVKEFALFPAYVGTGANLGKVRIRFNGTGLTSANLYVDQVYTSFSIVTAATGYEDSAVHLDTDNGTTGTTIEYNGISRRPAKNIADTLTLLGLLNLSKIIVSGDTTIAFAASMDGLKIEGLGYNVALGGKSCSNIKIIGADISGVCTGAVSPHFTGGDMSNATLPPSHLKEVGIAGTITVGSPGNYFMDTCHAHVAGTSLPIINYATVVNTNINMSNYHGGVELQNMVATSFLSLEGKGKIVVNANCSGGTILVRGHFERIDNSGGAVTIVRLANYSVEDVTNAIWDEILTGSTHNISNSAGRRLRLIVGGTIREGTAQGSGTGTNQIQLDAGASAVDGAYDPSEICITDGTGAGQSRMILEYNGSSVTATVDRDWKVTPDNTSKFVISCNPGRNHVNEGLAAAGSNNTITLNALASDSNNVYVGQIIFIRSGLGMDQAKVVTAYNGTSKVATVDSDWVVNPDTTTAYVMLPYQVDTLAEIGEVVADAVWNELLSGHTDAGSSGKALSDILARIGAFTGASDNTILGFLRAIMRNDVSAPSDVAGTYNPTLHSNQAIRVQGDIAWSSPGAGGGANNFNITVKIDDEFGATIAGVDVQVMDTGETTTIARLITGSAGLVNVDLDNGSYHVFFRGPGFQTVGGNPITMTVSGDTDQEEYMEAFNPGAPVAIDLCRITNWHIDGSGVAEVGKKWSAKITAEPTISGDSVVSYKAQPSTASNSEGYNYLDLIRTAEYEVDIDGQKYPITVPDLSTKKLKDLITA